MAHSSRAAAHDSARRHGRAAPSRRALSACLLALAQGACGLAREPAPTPAPTDTRRLEADLRADSARPGVAARLAAAYLSGGRGQDARALLKAARARAPRDPSLILLAGLAEERLGDDLAARRLYRLYLDQAPAAPFVGEVGGRLDRLDWAALPGELSRLLAQEPDRSAAPPDPSRVAVLPFVAAGRADLSVPLAAAFTELLTEDLARGPRFTAVDRALVRSLPVALGVPDEARDGAELAQRVGRLVGAGLVVVGRLEVEEGAAFQVTATMVFLGPAGTRTDLPFRGSALAAEIALMERRLALQVYDNAGARPSQRVAERIGHGATNDLSAWLSFGLGVTAWDARDYGDARGNFERAHRVDSGFTQAVDWMRRAARLADAATPPERVAWWMARVGTQRAMVDALVSDPGSPFARLSGLVGRRNRVALAELLGMEGVGGGTTLDILITPWDGR